MKLLETHGSLSRYKMHVSETQIHQKRFRNHFISTEMYFLINYDKIKEEIQKHNEKWSTLPLGFNSGIERIKIHVQSSLLYQLQYPYNGVWVYQN